MGVCVVLVRACELCHRMSPFKDKQAVQGARFQAVLRVVALIIVHFSIHQPLSVAKVSCWPMLE